ncbi:MAG: hypothetical protein IKF42_03235 [Mogibacterium sp.]|nr:hypothetical protein [Mogibacterium sp.]
MITIVNAYPDYLNLYGEYSAVKLLELRLRGLKQKVKIQELSFGRYEDIEAADMMYFSAGTENRMLNVLEDVRRYAKEIRNFVDNGKLLLISGCTAAVFCKTITDERSGRKYEGLGLFDANASITPKRRYGELICSYNDGPKVIGPVNSSVDFSRNDGQEPLFTVLWDSSKRFSKGSTEGMKLGDNVFASEITGPLICRNPHLLDLVAEKTAGVKLPECSERWYKEGQLAYEHTLNILLSEAHMKE